MAAARLYGWAVLMPASMLWGFENEPSSGSRIDPKMTIHEDMKLDGAARPIQWSNASGRCLSGVVGKEGDDSIQG